MPSPLSSNVTFSFAEPSSGSLTLENWGGFVGWGSVSLSLVDKIPTGTLRLFASVGEVVDFGQTASRVVPASFVQVDGSNTATIPREATYKILFALDATGLEIDPPLEISKAEDTVTFNRKFWGLLHVSSYNQSFKVLKYTPALINGVYTYGVVAAFKEGRMALCHVSPPVIAPGNDELEIYRVESKVLLNDKGEWEMPDGWPDNPSYPTGAIPPRPRIGVVSTRVHEVGMVTATGYFYSRTFDIQVQKPYFGIQSYRPRTSVVQGSGFSKLSDDMKIKAQEAMVRRGKGEFL